MASDNSESQSQDTTSTATLEDCLNISFEDLSYTVRKGIFSAGKKIILDRVAGTFVGGELTVLMGQSGAGKSSLLDILAGYTKPTSGRVLINGRPRDLALFRRRSCYIMQDDKVQDALTIKESLTIAAELKLGNHVSEIQKQTRLKQIITCLDLSKVTNTKARDLSGGQRKRLAIALELISDPQVIFMDEPTSGLDSSISKQMLGLLRMLAKQGRTVVTTIHQPSAPLLAMVDRLYAVDGGKCVYIGSVPNLIPYLDQNGFSCPPYHNVVDFLIEICSDKDTGLDTARKLVDVSQNGEETKWVSNITNEADVEKYMTCTGNEISLTTFPTPKENTTNKILLKLKSSYSTTYWKQFRTLSRRSLLSIWRDPQFTLTILAIHCGMALFVGVLFYNIGNNGFRTREIYHLLFFCLMFLMFTAFSAVSVNFPEQIAVVRREHFNRWYTTGAYFLSTLLSALPTQTICTMSFTVIVYFLTGQPWEWLRFALFTATLLLVSGVALCLGLLNGAVFSVKHGVIFGPLVIMPFTVFAGFFLRYVDAPKYLRWLFHISFLKHGLVGVVTAIFGMKRDPLICDELYCHYKDPEYFLKEIGMRDEEFLIAIVALLATASFLVIVSFIVLKIRLKCKW